MTRKLQHLFGRATLLLLLFFVSGVTFAQIAATVKCEIRGEGSANLNGLNADWSSFDFPIVSGETYTFDQLYGVSGNNTSISIGTIKGTLIDILIDGVHNEYSWSRYQGSGGYSSSILLTPDNDYYAELTLVFEGGEEPAATQTYTVDVVGQGSVDYSYTSESGDVKTGTFEPGVATGFDNMSMGAAYIIDITPKPAEGYKFAGMKMNGEEVADALQQYNEIGMVTLETAATDVKLEVTFKEDVPEYNVIYTVTVEGEGTADYRYYYDDGTNPYAEAKGTFEIGVATGLNPKLMGSNYGVDIYPKPAEGYKFVNALVNGTEVKNAVSKYEDFGYFPVNSSEKEIALHLVYEKEAVENPYTYTVTIEGEGSVDYYYLVDKTLAEVRGTIEPGVPLPANPIPSVGINFTPNPAEGYEFTAAYVDGVEDEDAKGQIEMFGYFNVIPQSSEVNVKIVFTKTVELPEEYDMIVNYTQEGEGVVNYSYFLEGDGSGTGNLAAGTNEFDDMYLASDGYYKMYLTINPAEGSVLKSVTVNGTDMTETYNNDGTLLLKSVGGETIDVKVVFEKEQQEPTGHKVVIKANGDIEYHIKFSNVAEQKQEFYYVSDKDTTVYLPDNAFCGWNYTYNPNFTVKNLLINGEPLLEPTFTVTSDLEISLDYVETGYYELEYEQPENGEIIVEYEVYDMNVYDYVYVPYEEGLALMTGTGYRVTYIADEDSYIANVKVDGEEVMNSTLEDPVYEFVYEGKVWGPVLFEAEILTEIAVDEVVAEPVQMTVYSVDGVLVRSCLAKDVKEAVEGLEKGLYIVNGQKVLVK